MALSTSNSDEANYNEVNNFMRDAKNDQTTRVIKDDQGTRVVMLDKNGLKTTPPGSGIDVFTAGDDDLSFNSAQNVFKIVLSDTFTTTLANTSNTVSSGEQTVSIPHGQSYKPAFVIYVETPSTYIKGNVLLTLPELHVLPAGHVLGGGTIFSQIRATVDSTNLNIVFFHRVNTDYSPSLPTFTIRYYLLQETAN